MLSVRRADVDGVSAGFPVSVSSGETVQRGPYVISRRNPGHIAGAESRGSGDGGPAP